MLKYHEYFGLSQIEEFVRRYNHQITTGDIIPTLEQSLNMNKFRPNDFVFWYEENVIKGYIHGSKYWSNESSDINNAMNIHLRTSFNQLLTKDNRTIYPLEIEQITAFETINYPLNFLFLHRMESFVKGYGRKLLSNVFELENVVSVMWPHQGKTKLIKKFTSQGFQESGIYFRNTNVPIMVKIH